MQDIVCRGGRNESSLISFADL